MSSESKQRVCVKEYDKFLKDIIQEKYATRRNIIIVLHNRQPTFIFLTDNEGFFPHTMFESDHIMLDDRIPLRMICNELDQFAGFNQVWIKIDSMDELMIDNLCMTKCRRLCIETYFYIDFYTGNWNIDEGMAANLANFLPKWLYYLNDNWDLWQLSLIGYPMNTNGRTGTSLIPMIRRQLCKQGACFTVQAGDVFINAHNTHWRRNLISIVALSLFHSNTTFSAFLNKGIYDPRVLLHVASFLHRE